MDDIWRHVPSGRPFDPAALDQALETVRHAGGQREASSARVLDLGCGDGRVAAELAKTGARVTGVDVSPVAIERASAANPELEFAVVSAEEALPFSDAAFDAVVCMHVLEHVADTQHFLSEARRVLAPHGRFAVSVPFHGRFKNLLIALSSFEQHHHPLQPVLRFYTRRSLASLLRDFGFEEVRIRAAGGPPLTRETLLANARRGSP